MEVNLKRLLGKGPYPFTFDSMEESMNVYLGNQMIVMSTRTTIDFLEEGTHVHSSYEFMTPLSPMPSVVVGKRKIEVEKNKLLPLNSEQEHGPDGQMLGCRMIAFQIEEEFIEEIARSMYGKTEVSFQNAPLYLDTDMQKLLRLFMMEERIRQQGYEFILESVTTQLTVNILRQANSNMPITPKERNYTEKENINRAIDFLRGYYHRSDYSLNDIAQVANLSPYHFIRVFKSETGKTPYDYLLDIKLEKAREMIRGTEKTITDICYQCGFNNLDHFDDVFKRKMGVTPSEFRRAIRL